MWRAGQGRGWGCRKGGSKSFSEGVSCPPRLARSRCVALRESWLRFQDIWISVCVLHSIYVYICIYSLYVHLHCTHFIVRIVHTKEKRYPTSPGWTLKSQVLCLLYLVKFKPIFNLFYVVLYSGPCNYPHIFASIVCIYLFHEACAQQTQISFTEFQCPMKSIPKNLICFFFLSLSFCFCFSWPQLMGPIEWWGYGEYLLNMFMNWSSPLDDNKRCKDSNKVTLWLSF